jgi:hypothetical protein
MCLWTAPVVIASQHSFDTSAFREVSSVFKVGDLNLFNDGLLANTAPVDHDIVWLDI